MTDTIPGEVEPELDRAGRIRLRSDETYFRLIAPREVAGFGIVQVYQFTPGGAGLYATATVIGVRTRYAHGSERVRSYSVHHLAHADDRGPDPSDGPVWYLYDGVYEIPTLVQAQLFCRER